MGRWRDNEYLAKTDFVQVPSLYQGYHDWHTDGDGDRGRRYHRFFVMIDKGNASHPPIADTTNVKLIPPEVLYAGTCTDGNMSGEDRLSTLWDRVSSRRPRMLLPPFSNGRSMGNNPDWHALEGLSCSFAMQPGDALFFREDTWHRTQDMSQDRLAVILDIRRDPEVNVPVPVSKFRAKRLGLSPNFSRSMH